VIPYELLHMTKVVLPKREITDVGHAPGAVHAPREIPDLF
jgi:hypothetical protein